MIGHTSIKNPLIYRMSLVYMIGTDSVKTIPFIYWMTLIYMIHLSQNI